ncbi:MAG: VKORC1/thioredoxin domain protein [Candidatus Jorgensenbacteria bacterium GW2011_GWA1_48_13]|uniref:VKORC1/thioredoxin domain protein n=1 Tax=Candidatus Jorgensenbacteria bacterium GW2011_GWB1_50_10 TaxID=1618665 RepID=A0A0G1W9H0_9BACT|nr:MAG: VKORC1/thioredoxin domain protein [Parcubacteria group bacterium GW2011_GWC1_45_9]KKU94282.1 MAG: VKORC1/thioredoxin domain protein [Candidatus Jorgensenbacteria bacterium GW2011_GWA1_48_13]KKW15446.1 MAG: VKORC1/thioredoxin domain protein [Candidatus Jorgensenbacteria bacterium GW2011_GWB1_50_10]
MRKYSLFIIILIIVAAAVAVLIINPGKKASAELNNFAACLAGKNITMYGAESCSWCQKEKANFGSAFEQVPYVECPDEPQKCIALGIEGTPTWIFPDGRKLVGYQGLQKLSEASGCSLPQN